MGPYLTIGMPVVARDVVKLDSGGYLIAAKAPGIKCFCMDVGFNKGLVTVDAWLEKSNDVFVIAVEALPQLHILFETMNTAADQIGDKNKGSSKDAYWKLSDFHASQRALRYKKHFARAFIVNGAVSTSPGVAEFHTGQGWDADGNGATDVASLFDFDDPSKSKSRGGRHTLVRKFRLDQVLKHVPPPPHANWDTLKIDIQGADVDALLSAGVYLKNFMCVIGEFETAHYKVPAGLATDPVPIMKAAGFVSAGIAGNMVWINPRRAKEYLAAPESFHCHTIFDVGGLTLGAVKAAFQRVG